MNPMHRACFKGLIALTLTASTASAAEAADPPTTEAAPSDRKMNLSVPPPDAPLERSAYVHNGLYARVAFGPGWLYSNHNYKPTGSSSDGNSFAIGADLMVGGSPAPGLALGVGALTNIAVSVPLVNRNISQFQFIVGPFFDAFPNDKRGFHLGAGLGFAGTTLGGLYANDFAVGGGGAAWVGYDIWIAPEWSAGFSLRGTGAFMTNDVADNSAFGLTALITLLRH